MVDGGEDVGNVAGCGFGEAVKQIEVSGTKGVVVFGVDIGQYGVNELLRGVHGMMGESWVSW